MDTRRESRAAALPYEEAILESAPLIPGTDAWARRRQLNRRAKLIGVAFSFGFLFTIAFVVFVVICVLILIAGESDIPHEKIPSEGVGKRTARLMIRGVGEVGKRCVELRGG
jgi:hypothetical protein